MNIAGPISSIKRRSSALQLAGPYNSSRIDICRYIGSFWPAASGQTSFCLFYDRARSPAPLSPFLLFLFPVSEFRREDRARGIKRGIDARRACKSKLGRARALHSSFPSPLFVRSLFARVPDFCRTRGAVSLCRGSLSVCRSGGSRTTADATTADIFYPNSRGAI